MIYNFMQAINVAPGVPKKPTMILRDSLIVGNRGYAPSAEDIGNGMLFLDLNRMLYNITVLIENCNVSNNIMSSMPAPLLSAKDHAFYLNISIIGSNSLNNSIPLTILLTSTSGDIHLNVIDSYFQNSSTPLVGQGFQIIQGIDLFGHTGIVPLDSHNTTHINCMNTRFEGDLKMKLD